MVLWDRGRISAAKKDVSVSRGAQPGMSEGHNCHRPCATGSEVSTINQLLVPWAAADAATGDRMTVPRPSNEGTRDETWHDAGNVKPSFNW